MLEPMRTSTNSEFRTNCSGIPRIQAPQRSHLFSAMFPLFLLATAAALLATPFSDAQSPAAPPPVQKAIHHHPRSKPSPSKAAQPQAEPAPVAPAPPAPPRWPVNDKPAQASVIWDSHGLRIEATNSSLKQIMRDVATATGTKVEGLGADERVFGAYGPGLARDVLSQLLQGAGYNVLMIGDQGHGAPRQIVLSSPHAAGDKKQAAADTDTPSDEDEPDAEEPPEQVVPMARPGFGPGGPRTPQQIMQEREMRQQQMQQMQQMQQNTEPPQ